MEVYGKVSAITLAVTMMLKFIISLPKSSTLCPSKSKTTTDSESHAICQRDSCTCTKANDTTPTTKTTGKRKSTQFYIDLGQKAFNSTTRCKRCQMVYIADDCDDKESHKKFCAQVYSNFMHGCIIIVMYGAADDDVTYSILIQTNS